MSRVEQPVRRPSGSTVARAEIVEIPEPKIVPPAAEPKPTRAWPVKRLAFWLIVLVGAAIAGYIGVNYYLDSLQYEWTDDAFIDGHIISLSPQVAARVERVRVNDNQMVKKGDVLVELDPTDYQVILDQVKATRTSMIGKLAQARTELEVRQANVGEAEAALNVSQTNAANMNQDYQRYLNLDPRARSQQQFDNATAAQRSTSATVRQAEAELAAAKAQVDDAAATVQTAIADVAKAAEDVNQAQIQLGYCTIVAPQDGIVTRKAIEEGMYLAVGQPLMSLVPTDVWVTANYKETQLDEMRPGQTVSVHIDAYPEHAFQGTVDSIQYGTGSKFSLLPPENATGNFVKVVQRVPVKIVFNPGQIDDPDHPLALGMSVEPSVKVRPRPSFWSLLGFSGGK